MAIKSSIGPTATSSAASTKLKKVKADEDPDIVLWGSSTLYPPLLEANLIDRFDLLICPIILGKGKKLFGNASHPVTMKLVSSATTKSGVIIASYAGLSP